MIPQDFPSCYYSSMRNMAVLVIHLIATLARLLGPGGVRSIVAESLLLKHQLLIVARSRQQSPNLCTIGPLLHRLNGTLGTSNSSAPFRNRSEAFDTAWPSQSFEQAKVPRAVLPESPTEARTETCGRRNEATESQRIAQQIALAFNKPVSTPEPLPVGEGG
jgi:hypothetical protein